MPPLELSILSPMGAGRYTGVLAGKQVSVRRIGPKDWAAVPPELDPFRPPNWDDLTPEQQANFNRARLEAAADEAAHPESHAEREQRERGAVSEASWTGRNLPESLAVDDMILSLGDSEIWLRQDKDYHDPDVGLYLWAGQHEGRRILVSVAADLPATDLPGGEPMRDDRGDAVPWGVTWPPEKAHPLRLVTAPAEADEDPALSVAMNAPAWFAVMIAEQGREARDLAQHDHGDSARWLVDMALLGELSARAVADWYLRQAERFIRARTKALTLAKDSDQQEDSE